MSAFKLPRMKLANLQSFSESCIILFKPFDTLSQYVSGVEEKFQLFKEGMLKSSGISERKMVDKIRDNYIFGIMYAVNSEGYFPHTGSLHISTYKKLSAVTNKYGTQLSRLPYDQQTAETDNLLSELKMLDLSGFPHIDRWVGLLEEANEEFKTVTEEQRKENVVSDKVISATEAAKELENALEDLFEVAYFNMKFWKDADISNAYDELAELIDNYS